MSDTITRLTDALEDLRDQLAHADTLITEQQDGIQDPRTSGADPRAKVNAIEGAAWSAAANPKPPMTRQVTRERRDKTLLGVFAT